MPRLALSPLAQLRVSDPSPCTLFIRPRILKRGKILRNSILEIHLSVPIDVFLVWWQSCPVTIRYKSPFAELHPSCRVLDARHLPPLSSPTSWKQLLVRSIIFCNHPHLNHKSGSSSSILAQDQSAGGPRGKIEGLQDPMHFFHFS